MSDVTACMRPGYPYCAAAKSDYTKRGVSLREANAQRNEKALQEMLKHSGGRGGVPVIVEEGKVTSSFGGS